MFLEIQLCREVVEILSICEKFAWCGIWIVVYATQICGFHETYSAVYFPHLRPKVGRICENSSKMDLYVLHIRPYRSYSMRPFLSIRIYFRKICVFNPHMRPFFFSKRTYSLAFLTTFFRFLSIFTFDS